MRAHWTRIAAIALSCSVAFLPNDASACGGCFVPPSDDTTVTGHRMAFAVSQERTVLWDQFQYSGTPGDFSWVLPVRPGAYIESATDAWFEALEAFTKTLVFPPTLTCAQSEDSYGCGVGMASDEASAAGAGDDSGVGVMVVHSGTVGPYETVTLRSADGDALSAWLDEHGYVIAEEIQPIIDAYVDEGADFIALRLQPNAGVNQMTPVRVITPGAEAILPLRMVAAGVGVAVDIVLYLIGEARYGMPDLKPVHIDPEELTYDFDDNDSNYEELREIALADTVGFNYLTTFADLAPFAKSYDSPSGFTRTFFTNGTIQTTFVDLYFAQAHANDARLQVNPCSVAAALASNVVVQTEPGTSAPDVGDLTCDGYDDLATALVGMRPARTWLSRLELHLPREALTMDCVVEPEAEQEPVSSMIEASKALKRPSSCDQPVFESSIAHRRPSPIAPWLLAGASALLALRRRRRSSS